MCIKIKSCQGTIEYDVQEPLEHQLSNDCQVIIDYKASKDDDEIGTFVKEMSRLSKSGFSKYIDIKFSHNNQIIGAKAKKQVDKLTKDLKLNEAIKLLVTLQKKANDTLVELSDICRK